MWIIVRTSVRNQIRFTSQISTAIDRSHDRCHVTQSFTPHSLMSIRFRIDIKNTIYMISNDKVPT